MISIQMAIPYGRKFLHGVNFAVFVDGLAVVKLRSIKISIYI